MKDPVRNVSQEFLSGLEMVSNKIYPLPGAVFNRTGDVDKRLSHLTPMTNVPIASKIAFYEHLATVRHQSTNKFFVAFRQTMDALMLEQSDTSKYPEWLIKSDVKKTELRTHIYAVKEINGRPVIPSRIPGGPSTHEDWLSHISVDWVFDTLAYFLLHNHIITEEMFKKIL